MNRIKELRERRGIQQKELAIDLGVTQPTISNWELGIKVPSARSTQKLAEYFGVSMDYVTGREEQDNQRQTSDPKNEKSALKDKDGFESRAIRLIRAASRLPKEHQTLLLVTLEAAVRAFQNLPQDSAPTIQRSPEN